MRLIGNRDRVTVLIGDRAIGHLDFRPSWCIPHGCGDRIALDDADRLAEDHDAVGMLEGEEATTHWWAQSSLARFGTIARPDSRVVRSGKIWTAAGVSAGLDLALTLVDEIAGREAAEVAQLMIEYDPQPPFNSGAPNKASERVRQMAAAELARLAKNPRDLISIPQILWRRAISRSRKR